MYKIAICDDEEFTCSNIETTLLEYSQKSNLKVQVDIFGSGEKLLKVLESKALYDIIFLDIDLVTISGVDIGKKLRDELENESTKLIYISSKTSYAMQLFKTRPIDFLIKPLCKNDILDVLIRCVKIINSENEVFEFSIGANTHRVFYKDILYFRSIGRKILITLCNESVEFYGKLDEIANQLPFWDFLQIHKSYVINCNNVIEYTYETVKMKNKEILTISQANRKNVREKLLTRRKRNEC